MSHKIGSERHAIRVVRVVIVIVAARVNIIEVIVVVSRPQPPDRGAGRITEQNLRRSR